MRWFGTDGLGLYKALELQIRVQSLGLWVCGLGYTYCPPIGSTEPPFFKVLPGTHVGFIGAYVQDVYVPRNAMTLQKRTVFAGRRGGFHITWWNGKIYPSLCSFRTTATEITSPVIIVMIMINPLS